MENKTVSTAEFVRHFGKYHDEAQRAPLTLTKHGRASVVVVSAETFQRLMRNDDPRRVYGAGETPRELSDFLLAELERQSAAFSDESDD